MENKNSAASRTKKGFDDTYLRIMMVLIAAHLMTNYDEPESFFEAIFKEDYQRGFIASAVIAFFIVYYIHVVNNWLDKKYSWLEQMLNRMCWQLILAFVVPSFLVFLLVAAFFGIFGLNIFQTGYLQQNYIVATLMILIANLYYFGVTTYIQFKAVKKQLISTTDTHKHKDYTSAIQVMDGKETRLLPVEDISSFYIVHNQVLVQNRKNESFMSNGYTLDDLENLLDSQYFFRINRQLILHRNEISGYEDAGYGKLTVNVKSKNAVPATISQRKAPHFRKWIIDGCSN